MAQVGHETPTPAFIPAWDAGSRDDPQSATQGTPSTYELRPGVRMLGKVTPTAWLDQDKSGNYKAKLNNVRKPRARKVTRPRKDSILKPTTECGNDEAEEPNHEQKSQSKLSMRDSSGGSQEQAVNGESDFPSLDASTLTSAPNQQRNLSARTSQHQDETFTTFDGYTPEDAAARSCKSCFAFGLHCSLLAEGSRHPCDLCIADGEDCELMREPISQQRCLSCKKKRTSCSFVLEPGRRGPCDSCVKFSTHCGAGSSRSTARKNDEHARVVRKEQVQAPSQIRRTRECTVELNSRSIIPRVYSRRRDTAQGVKFADSKDYDHVISCKNVPSNLSTGVFQTIFTRFAHPIKLNYEPPTPLDLISCHWCDDILYGLFGLGPVEVEVIDYRNGGGYKEIENGHTCAGHLPSRMCIKCTLARLTIAACTSHEVEPIEGVNPDAFTVSSYQGYLVPGMTAFAPFEWCCICPTPASYQCLKRQEPDMLCSHPRDGCGLLLCERCASFLVGKFGGVLERLIDELKLQYGESVLRADAEFLHPKGELLRRFFNAGGIS